MVVFNTAHGWSAEIVDLDLTRPPKSRTDRSGDGPQFLVRHHGRFVAYVRTVEEFADYLDVASLRREGPGMTAHPSREPMLERAMLLAPRTAPRGSCRGAG